jgi:segregation and condensation protein B
MDDLKKKVEAILFSAGRVVQVKEFQSLLGLKDPGLINESVKDLIKDYQERESPIMVVEEDDGWKLSVKEAFLPLVQHINPHTELSKSMLETLAVITWKQPILQSDVIKIRTNKAYEHISELERLGFIVRQKHGRSFLIKVTQKFLDYFDLPDANAVKEVFKDFKDVEVAVQKKGPEMKKAESEEEGASSDAEGDTAADEASGDAEVYDDFSGQGSEDDVSDELEPYIDVLPEVKKLKRGTELEVYEAGPEQEEEPEAEEKEQGAVEEETPEPAEGEEESEEEKARRLAEQVLEEHGEVEEQGAEEEEEDRRLHPQLEEFIAKSVDELAPKPTEEHEVPEEPEAEEPEHGEEHEGPEQHQEPEPEDSDEEEEMPAEEYPGQFADQSEEEPEEKEER